MPTALVSVYNKNGVVEFCRELIELGWDIIASGGTAKVIFDARLPVRDVASLVGGGPILGHRVVTLSREVYAGLLSREEDEAELDVLRIPRIDLVCVDLYPLETAVKDPNATRESVIELTDIGGPTLLRAAAKGRRIVVCDQVSREAVINWLNDGRPDKENFISQLAAKAEALVADYCLTSARYHSNGKIDGLIGREVLVCHYGENNWQVPAGLFSVGSNDPLALEEFKVISGSDPSHDNLCDLDRMLQAMTHIAAALDLNYAAVPCIALAVKHGNVCGAAVRISRIHAVQEMVSGDKRAIFGGLVMVNFEIGKEEADALLHYEMNEGNCRILDGIIAPSFTRTAIRMLKGKDGKCRLIENRALCGLKRSSIDSFPCFRQVRGGFLRRPNYTFVLDLRDPRIIKTDCLNYLEERDFLLAWAIGSTSNSNTITLVRDGKLIANFVSQQDRVPGCELALRRAWDAGHTTMNALAYTNSFFPFTDGPTVLIRSGIKAILTSSGSVLDEEVMRMCRVEGAALFLIPDSIVSGFYGH